MNPNSAGRQDIESEIKTALPFSFARDQWRKSQVFRIHLLQVSEQCNFIVLELTLLCNCQTPTSWTD